MDEDNGARVGRPREPIEHGTLSGARKEARRRVPLCPACRDALRAYRTEYWRARRAAVHGRPA